METGAFQRACWKVYLLKVKPDDSMFWAATPAVREKGVEENMSSLQTAERLLWSHLGRLSSALYVLAVIIQHRYRWRCEERRAATAFCVCKVYKDDDRLLSNTIEGQSLCMFNKCMTRGCLHYTALSVANILMGVSSCLEKANANGTGNICLFSSLSLMWIFGPHLYV